jgi:hypothetical protein
MIAAEQMRMPFFILAAVLLGAAIALEFGSGMLLVSGSTASAASSTQGQFGIPALWLVDIALAWNVALVFFSRINPMYVARVQGVPSLIIAIVVIISGIVTAIKTFVLLMVMLALIPSVIGFFVYLALFHFSASDANVVLSAITFFKLAFAVLLIVAGQGFLKSKGLVLMIAVSLLCDLLLSFLHALVPSILFPVTDAVGAIIIAVIAIVYEIVALVWAIVALVRWAASARVTGSTQRT